MGGEACRRGRRRSQESSVPPARLGPCYGADFVAATHFANACEVPYLVAKPAASALRAALHDCAALTTAFTWSFTELETAFETHLPKALAELPLPCDELPP